MIVRNATAIVFFLHKKVQGKGEEGGVLIVTVIAGHEQQEQNDEQIACVKILGKQALQEVADAGICLRFLFLGRRSLRAVLSAGTALGRTGELLRRLGLWRFRGCRAWLRLRLPPLGLLRLIWFRHSIAPVGAVGLWDVTVIHGISPALSEFQRAGTHKACGKPSHFCCAHGLFQLGDPLPA